MRQCLFRPRESLYKNVIKIEQVPQIQNSSNKYQVAYDDIFGMNRKRKKKKTNKFSCKIPSI